MSKLPIINYIHFLNSSKKYKNPQLETAIKEINYLINIPSVAESTQTNNTNNSYQEKIDDIEYTNDEHISIINYIQYINTFNKSYTIDLINALQIINNLIETEKDDDELLVIDLLDDDIDYEDDEKDGKETDIIVALGELESLFKESEIVETIEKDNDNDISPPKLQTINWIDEVAINQIKKDAELDKSHEQEKKNRLNNYLSKLNPDKPIIDIQDYSIFDEITKKAPNFKEALDYFKGSFVLNHFKMKQKESYQAPLPLLLLGDPGIGKTFFAKELAKCLNTSSYIIDANSISATWVLTGSSGQWKNAEAGLIFRQMLDCPTISPIIIFDEIDKLSSGKNYDPFSAFHQLLEPENSKILKDEYINCSFNASNIIYILTANDVNGIPESLLSRMKVLNIKKPDAKTTHIIAQNIYSSIIGKSGLFKEELNCEQLEQLETMTPREIKQLLNNSVFNQASQIDMTNIENVETNQTLIIIKKDKPKRVLGF
jgi:ATP-dependent Lon protease